MLTNATQPNSTPAATAIGDPEDSLLAQAFTRAAGAPLLEGHEVKLLRNASENYPAWLDAIRSAEHRIFFESYFICDDDAGREFAAALAERARSGVRVRLIYDWLGALRKTSRRFWREICDAGVEIRAFNPPRLDSPLGWLHRDHRKMLAIDSRVGFITGLCVGDMWRGDAAHGREPWRDTGLEIRGPALHDIERAFSQVWAAIGTPLPESEICKREDLERAGSVSLRIVANAPGDSALFRVDQLIAAAARKTLWLTDAYFAGIPPYLQALGAAARDGVDVRLLVPGASDIPILRPLSQAGYRPLLESGIRVFEWNGSMLHAKTAVADGMWARVGSSNLNVASWMGNYELDAVVENEQLAGEMEQMYEADLENSTEIVLHPKERTLAHLRSRMQASLGSRMQRRGGARRGTGSASRVTAGALRLGRTVSAALAQQRILAPTEGRTVAIIGIVAFALATIGVLWPRTIAVPFALILAWIGVALLMRARALRRERRARGLPRTRVTSASQDEVTRQEGQEGKEARKLEQG